MLFDLLYKSRISSDELPVLQLAVLQTTCMRLNGPALVHLQGYNAWHFDNYSLSVSYWIVELARLE